MDEMDKKKAELDIERYEFFRDIERAHSDQIKAIDYLLSKQWVTEENGKTFEVKLYQWKHWLYKKAEVYREGKMLETLEFELPNPK